MTARMSAKPAKRAAARDERVAAKAAAKVVARGGAADSFQNFLARLGVGTDNLSSGGSYGFNPITRIRTLLEWIHRGSWIGGVAIDVVADDMVREGIDIHATNGPDDIEVINNEMEELGIHDALGEGVAWGRLYGGAGVIPLIDGADYSTPLDVTKIGPGQFKGLMVVDRWMVEPSLSDLIRDPGPYYGLPKWYRVNTDGPGLRNVQIHHTRFWRFIGVRLPYWQRLMENLWGISVLERLYDRLLAFDSASQGAAQLVYKSYLRTVKIKDLRQNVATGGDAYEGLIKYMGMMSRYQGLEGITLLDSEDEFEGHTHGAFGGLGEALMQFGQQLSGALQIPLVRLFGQSPAGLNSSGESDLRTYYDGIKKDQRRYLRRPYKAIVPMIAASKGIKLDPKWSFDFKPLWQLTDEQKSQIAERDTNMAVNAEAAGLVPMAAALKELRQQSRVTGRWTNITDEDIEAAEAQPAPDIDITKLDEKPPGEGEDDEHDEPQGKTRRKP